MKIKCDIKNGIALECDVSTTEEIEAFVKYCDELREYFGWAAEDAAKQTRQPSAQSAQSAHAPKATQMQLDIMSDYNYDPWPNMTKKEAYYVVKALLNGEPVPERKAASRMSASSGPATEKQKAVMIKHSIPFSDGITSAEASALITASIEASK